MGPNWTTISSEDHYFLVMTNDPTIGLLPYTQHLLTLKGRSMIFFGFGLALSFHPESYQQTTLEKNSPEKASTTNMYSTHNVLFLQHNSEQQRKASWNTERIKTTFPQELAILKSNYLKMISELGEAAFIIFCQRTSQTRQISQEYQQNSHHTNILTRNGTPQQNQGHKENNLIT